MCSTNCPTSFILLHFFGGSSFLSFILALFRVSRHLKNSTSDCSFETRISSTVQLATFIKTSGFDLYARLNFKEHKKTPQLGIFVLVCGLSLLSFTDIISYFHIENYFVKFLVSLDELGLSDMLQVRMCYQKTEDHAWILQKSRTAERLQLLKLLLQHSRDWKILEDSLLSTGHDNFCGFLRKFWVARPRVKFLKWLNWFSFEPVNSAENNSILYFILWRHLLKL